MHSLIQWPRAKYWDKCWNPMLGCKLISPACAYCYAKFLTKQRFKHSFVPHETGKLNPPRKDVVFCGNMTDLFGDWVDAEARIDFIVNTNTSSSMVSTKAASSTARAARARREAGNEGEEGEVRLLRRAVRGEAE